MFKLTIAPEDIEKLEPACFKGQIHVISHPGLEFSRAIAYLRKQTLLGFDTESKPVFTPGQPHNGVALLQLSGPDQAFLFRIQKLGMRKRICAILANPNIIKVGAASLDDVRGLQRYQSFQPRGFVDLQKIVWEWGIRDKSVKKMAANILGVRISKSQQLSNWEAETLNSHQQLYAATDAWVCREMYLKLQQCEKHPLRPEEMCPPEQLPLALREKLEKNEKDISEKRT
jgi:ribonuclease D